MGIAIMIRPTESTLFAARQLVQLLAGLKASPLETHRNAGPPSRRIRHERLGRWEGWGQTGSLVSDCGRLISCD